MQNVFLRILAIALLAALMLPGAICESLAGEDILQLEQQLYALGYHTETCDAQLDDATRRALRSFQTANGLAVTGEFDRATIDLLADGEPITCHDYLIQLAAASADQPPLQSGSSGQAVSQLQTALRKLGYLDAQADGYFSSATEAAVRRFQIANGLTETGIADHSVMARLDSDSSLAWTDFLNTFTYQPGDSSPAVRLVQRMLSELGYFTGAQNGLFGDRTREAISAFQEANGLEASGEMDAAFAQVLFSDEVIACRSPDVLRIGDDSEAVAELQTRLYSLGYYEKSITGFFTATTETSVRLFQMANALPASGEVDAATLGVLNSDLALSLSVAADLLSSQIDRQDGSVASILAGLALQMRGQPFATDDEDLYRGFAFLQYLCVESGIPIVSTTDLLGRLQTEYTDLSAIPAGTLLAIHLGDGADDNILLAISTGGGRCAYATSASGWVLESDLTEFRANSVYGWNLAEGAQ